MDKRIKWLLIVAFLFVIVIGIGIISWRVFSVCCEPAIDVLPPGQQKIQACPDAWYDNQMPTVIFKDQPKSQESTEYFIVDGKRRELDEFDLDWIAQHCSLEKGIVQ